MEYSTIAKIAQQGGTLYFVLIFVAGCVYAFLPRKKAEFERAAQAPLQEDA